LAGPLEEADETRTSLTPVLPLELDFNGQALSLFTIITTVGTPQDITADELRVEAFFPADPATERFFPQHLPWHQLMRSVSPICRHPPRLRRIASTGAELPFRAPTETSRASPG
jgi:hypothetical protein